MWRLFFQGSGEQLSGLGYGASKPHTGIFGAADAFGCMRRRCAWPLRWEHGRRRCRLQSCEELHAKLPVLGDHGYVWRILGSLEGERKERLHKGAGTKGVALCTLDDVRTQESHGFVVPRQCLQLR